MRRPSLVFLLVFGVLAYFLGYLLPLLALTLVSVAIAFGVSLLFQKYLVHDVPNKATVLVTGCSTGFGKEIVYQLAAKGFVVFAGVRKQVDGDNVVQGAPKDSQSRIKPIILDVTNTDDINAAVQTIQSYTKTSGGSFVGLVNNAGIQYHYPLEIQPEERLRKLWEVNWWGQISVTRAFLPLLREAKPLGRARVVFIGSLAASGVTKYFGSYSATKVAIELVADELRRDLAPWKIGVSVIMPGTFITALGANFVESQKLFQDGLLTSDEIKASKFKLYEKGYTKFLKTVMNPPPMYAPLQWVAQQTEYCLLAKFPPAKRAVGIDAHLISALSWIVPDSVLDLVVGLIL